MDKRCKSCPCICKRLDSEDDPAHYRFEHLTPAEAISIVEMVAHDHRYWHIEEAAHERSTGDQLVILFRCKSNSDDCPEFVVIVQARDCNPGIDLWFRYGVPEEVCYDFSAVTELTELIKYTLKALSTANGDAKEQTI
ncbi:MAG: hypothetical protein U0103_03355 [Candidatus Obscuribacterales bacterium]|nr:hypothetical protein [Cyanobacteria bacterium SZAS LIN-5]